MQYDFLVVGTGLAGSVIAGNLARFLSKKVLIAEKRSHIGGNTFDFIQEDGLLVHKYGPHLFHTNDDEVFRYLSRFTEWNPYEHRVRAKIIGRLLPIPINLDTVNEFFGMNLSSEEMDGFLDTRRERFDNPRNSEEVALTRVGRELYEAFFKHYTRKQWNLWPSELSPEVVGRIPVRTNRDDRYFTDRYQAMPKFGYTKMFERMLDHPNIEVLLNTDYRDVVGTVNFDRMVYTGPLDEFFDRVYGPLPYRSLEFRFETHDVERYQPVAVVNYPQDEEYTRITEYKHFTFQKNEKTVISKEFPRGDGDPYYPIPREENQILRGKYMEKARALKSVHFVGRLAEYRYINMDQVIRSSLDLSRRIASQES